MIKRAHKAVVVVLATLDEGDIILQLEKLPSITLEESVQLDM